MAYQNRLALCFALCVGCMAEGAQDSDVASAEEPLLIIDLGDEHTVELYDYGDGTRSVSETARLATPAVVPAKPSSFVALFRQLKPAEEVPTSLIESDLKRPHLTAPEGVGVVEQAASTSEWRQVTGGCICPYGTLKKQVCQTNRTGNFSETHKTDWFWYSLNSIKGDGFDLFVLCNGHTTKTRFNTGFYKRSGCEGGGNSERIEVKGADVGGSNEDHYDLSACWVD